MRIVSVTPLSVDLDSRAYRTAASLARLGHESVVVEGQGSINLLPELPFELISAGDPRPATIPAVPPAPPAAPAPTRGVPVEGVRGLPRRVAYALVAARQRALFPTQRLRAYLQVLAGVLRPHLRLNLRVLRALPAADAYYMHSFDCYLAVRLASLLRGSPLVYDAADSYFEPYSPLNGQSPPLPPGARMFEALEASCIRCADVFVTSAEGVAELQLARHGRRPAVLHNFHDSRLDEEVAVGIRERLGLGPMEFLTVIVGNTKPGSTEGQALRALALLPARFHLAVVGQQQPSLGALAAELGLNDRLHVLAPVRETELSGFLRSADASAVLHRGRDANYVHQQPLRVFHSVAAGLPLIYTRLPGVLSVAEPLGLGIGVDPTDPAAIAAAISALADPRRARELRANVEAAATQLSWEREERALANLLSSLEVRRRAETLAAQPEREAPI